MNTSIHTSGRAFGLTDTGRVRPRNEDCFLILPEKELYIVADGMGGHNAGDMASSLAVQALADFFAAETDKVDSVKSRLIQGFFSAHAQVIEAAQKNENWAGMGCTLVVAMIRDSFLHLCHVGDSRGYLVNKDSLQCLTLDHSLVMAMVEAGEMSVEIARHSPLKNRLLQAIGSSASIRPEYTCKPLSPGDRVLLCTDGLWDMLRDEDIQDILTGNGSPEILCRTLVHKALEKGGLDNVTAVVIQQ